MRVLLIDNSPAPGDSIRGAAVLLRQLTAQGVEIGVTASRPDLFFPELGSRVHFLPVSWDGFRNVFNRAHGLRRNWPPILAQTLALRRFAARLTPEIRRILNDFRPDLVHVNNFNLPNLPVVVTARDAGLPVVAQARMIRRYGRRELLLADYATRIVCVSDAVRRYVVDLVPRLADRFTVVPDGIEASDEVPTVDRAALGLRPEQPVACHPAKLSIWKGQHVAITAWRRVLERFPDAVLLLLGEGESDYESLCRMLAERLGIAASVRFLGARPDEAGWVAAGQVILQASCFGDPERGAVEAYGRSVLEAMAAGRAVVATAVGGTPELVRDGATGYLARPNDPNDLAEKLIAALSDGEWRRQAGQAGRLRAREFYSPARVAATMSEVYREALKVHGERG